MKRFPLLLSCLTFGLSCFLAAPSTRAAMISPLDVLADGASKKAFEKIQKDPKDAEAIATIRKAAASDKDAQFTLAFLLQNGIGAAEGAKPEAILGEAKELYKKAAEAGQLAGYNNLGLLRLVVGEDSTQAIADIQKAADRSHGKSRITLAQIYLQGTGVEKNLDQSIRWLQRAEEQEPLEAGHLIAQYMENTNNHAGAVEKLTACAEKNYIPSMLYLGNKLLSGAGVARDIPTAQKWFDKAEATGDLNAIVSQGLVHEALASVEKDEAKRAEAFKKAMTYFERAAEKKVPDAFNKLGYFHQNGLGVSKDEAKALGYYKQGAEAKLPVAMFNYGVFLEGGIGNDGKKDGPAGLKWIYDAANAGLAPAMVALGERYRTGSGGLGVDPIAGMAWMEKAAKSGDMGATMTLANMLQTGEAGFVNANTAANLYLEAVKKGQPVAAFQLGSMLEKGEGIGQDLVKAYGLFAIAAQVLGADEKVGPTVKERFAKLKEKLGPEQVTQGEQFYKQLVGNAAASPAPTAAPEAAKPEAPKPEAPKKPEGEKKPKSK